MRNVNIEITSPTPYMAVPYIKRIISKKAQELRINYKVRSMFFFDNDNNMIYICTNYPGYWIGKNGRDVEDLGNHCNAAIDRYNELNKDYPDFQREHIKIAFIEASC